MDVSRRDLMILLPILAGESAAAQSNTLQTADANSQPKLHSEAYSFSQLPVHISADGTWKTRPVFDGITSRGQRLTMHISELAPGKRPHPPARQPHEEIIVIREGTLEVSLNGQITTLGPGSVIFSDFNDLNGFKNAGSTWAQYYVISIEQHPA